MTTQPVESLSPERFGQMVKAVTALRYRYTSQRLHGTMNIGVDPVAFALALLVAFLTIIEFRRNHSVILHIIDVSTIATQAIDENNAQLFYSFRILIRNLGIPLHSVAVTLQFRPPDGSGSMQLRLPPIARSHRVESGEFAKGMIGEFGFKTYQMDRITFQLLRALKNPVEQEAKIVVYSQGYRAKAFKVGVGVDLLKRRWSELGGRINPMFDSFVTPKGSRKRLLKTGNVIPTWPSIWKKLTEFLGYIESMPLPPEGRRGTIFGAVRSDADANARPPV